MDIPEFIKNHKQETGSVCVVEKCHNVSDDTLTVTAGEYCGECQCAVLIPESPDEYEWFLEEVNRVRKNFDYPLLA